MPAVATTENPRKGAPRMPAANTTKWLGLGLLALPLYGVLTFWSSLDPQPDPNTHYEAWSRYVTTDYYVLTHVFGSILDRKSTRLNSSHANISYAVFCLKKKKHSIAPRIL